MRLLLTTTFALATAAHAVAQTVPTGFTVDTLVSSGLQAGHDFAFLPDGRVLIANRGGAVMVYAGGAPVTVGTVPAVETGSERGLLGITADPAFASNGYIYVWYSSTADAFLHLDRFTCTGDLANASSTLLSFASTSRRVILAAIPDNAFNHNGGSPRFGPDGMLYQSIGDDANACTAQSTTSSLGCVLRMNVGGVPAGGGTTAPTFDSLDPGDNPLSANAGSISQLVIANGLRNPVRMEIDQATGNLYIGDVGQNAVEEYSEYVRGSTLGLVNFGWPWREGNNTFSSCTGTQPALVAPIAAVAQSGSGWLSVMGGPRYRNQTGGVYNFGAAYEGVAFYLDYFAGQVRAVQNTGSGWSALPAVPGQPNATNWGTNFVGTVSFRQGPDGAIWFLQHPGTYPTTGGTLKRIRPLGPTNSVVAVSGGGQVGVASEAFATPLRVQVRDTNGNALPGGTVNFAVTGAATLSTTNPVVADGSGFAQTNVTATITGGAITVTGSTPGSQTNATFSLFARKLTTTPSGTLLVVTATNTTTASPPNVPYILMASFPGSPILSTSIGPICTDPSYALTVVLEDGTGAFGGASLSGSGSIGNPSKTWLYTVPAGLLTGYQMRFQAVGLDPVTGWFRTNCDIRQF
jgi:glucose/arabinose dehydrogenase